MVCMNEIMNNWQCNVWTYECIWKKDGERMSGIQCEQNWNKDNVNKYILMLMFLKNLWYYVWIKQDKKKIKQSRLGLLVHIMVQCIMPIWFCSVEPFFREYFPPSMFVHIHVDAPIRAIQLSSVYIPNVRFICLELWLLYHFTAYNVMIFSRNLFCEI